jgi:hypothetical protein
MFLQPYIEAFNWIANRLDSFSNWITRKRKRDNVQGMEQNLNNNDSAGIDERLRQLRKKTKDRVDGD